MRKQYFGRQLKRDTNERKALFKGLASSLVIHERIQTTEAKAKAVRPLVEKLVTRARIGDVQAHSLLQPYLNAQALTKMLTDIGPRFKDRPGGYTRIIKVGPRLQDNASVVILEWVEKAPAATAVSLSKGSKERKETRQTKGKVEATATVKKVTVKKKPVRQAQGKSVKKAAKTKETK